MRVRKKREVKIAEIHVLNVGEGDCIIFKSGSGHVTMFDICGGNLPVEIDLSLLFFPFEEKTAVKGDYQMCKSPSNPIRFLKNKMGVSQVFRFILSHPDMDHMDGFNNLIESVTVLNFWDSGVRREKPDFSQNSNTHKKYKEEDWDRYVSVRDNHEGITVVTPRTSSKGKYWNEDDSGEGGDYITVCAPNDKLVEEANDSGSNDAINAASYVIFYWSAGGRILLPGDAHDKTWEVVLENFGDVLANCEFMVAPHHGRDSKRSWDFLDKIMPKFTVFGCASSHHLAYNAWNNRGLEKITQNQAGNISIYPNSEGLDVYVENKEFASDYGGNTSKTDKYGNYYLKRINKAK